MALFACSLHADGTAMELAKSRREAPKVDILDYRSTELFFFNLTGLESKKNKRYQLWLDVEMLSDPTGNTDEDKS